MRYLAYCLLIGICFLILTGIVPIIVHSGYTRTILADLAIWTLPVLPLWWLLIRWQKRVKSSTQRILLQLVISLLSFLPWGIALWCTSHSWLVRPAQADSFGTGLLLLFTLCAITLCLLAVSLLIGKIEQPVRKKTDVSAIYPSLASEEIGIVNIEHNLSYNHIVITLNHEGKEQLKCRLARLLPQYEHEFDCPDEISCQHLSGEGYTPCEFYNITHAPSDVVYGDIDIAPHLETLIVHANRKGISLLLQAVDSLSEQNPETSCDAHTVPDTATPAAPNSPQPYASVITFRFRQDESLRQSGQNASDGTNRRPQQLSP